MKGTGLKLDNLITLLSGSDDGRAWKTRVQLDQTNYYKRYLHNIHDHSRPSSLSMQAWTRVSTQAWMRALTVASQQQPSSSTNTASASHRRKNKHNPVPFLSSLPSLLVFSS